MLLEQKKAEGKSFYISMDEIEMANIEAEREKEEARFRSQSRPRSESSKCNLVWIYTIDGSLVADSECHIFFSRDINLNVVMPVTRIQWYE